MKRRLIALILLAAMLGCATSALAYTKNAQGLYVDESGIVIADYWDDAAGIYIVDGVGYAIENTDGGASSSSSSSPSSSSGGAANLPKNADGSVTVESGQIQIEDPTESTGSGHLTQEEWAARWAKYTAKNGTTTGTVYMDEAGTVVPAEIKYLGLGRSTIVVNGETMLVPTSSLKWDTEAPENKLLAVVTTTKQSYVTLRAKSSTKAFVMGHCEKGKVLRVIRTGKTWTFVDDEGVRGYVLTSGLTFYDNAPRQWAPGIITVKGKTPRGNYVHFRTSPSNKGKQSAVEYPVGTPITVFNQEGDWSEIDLAGYHCYMLSKFVTLQEPLVKAEEAGENPGLAPAGEAAVEAQTGGDNPGLTEAGEAAAEASAGENPGIAEMPAEAAAEAPAGKNPGIAEMPAEAAAEAPAGENPGIAEAAPEAVAAADSAPANP